MSILTPGLSDRFPSIFVHKITAKVMELLFQRIAWHFGIGGCFWKYLSTLSPNLFSLPSPGSSCSC